jgi:hypothetical protein
MIPTMFSSTDFTVSLLGADALSTANRIPGGASTAGRGEPDGFVLSRSQGRQQAVFMAVSGSYSCPLSPRCFSRVLSACWRGNLARGSGRRDDDREVGRR